MFNHALVTIRRSMLAYLLLVAFVVAAINGPIETKSAFQGSHPTIRHKSHSIATGNNPLYQPSAVADLIRPETLGTM